MVCKTFMFTPAVDASGAATGAIDFTKSYAAGCAGTISILFTFVAIAFGWAQKKFNLTGAAEFVTGVVLMVLMFAVGMQFPVYLDKFQCSPSSGLPGLCWRYAHPDAQDPA